MNKRIKNFINCISVFALIGALFIGFKASTIDAIAEPVGDETSLTQEQVDQLLASQAELADYNELYGFEPASIYNINTFAANSNSYTEGHKTYIAVFIEFPDMTHHLDDTQSVSNAYNFLNEGNGSITFGGGTTKAITSLNEYVTKYSYGKCTVGSEIFPRSNPSDRNSVVSYTASHNRGYYMPYDSTSNTIGYRTTSEQTTREFELIGEAANAISSQISASGITEDDLDANGDGAIDAITFFTEANDVFSSDNPGWSDLLWSHKVTTETDIYIQNLQILTYNLICTYDYKEYGGIFSMDRSTYGTIIHEYLHTLGFPDLYRYYDPKDGVPVGAYDVMAGTINYDPQPLLMYMLSEYPGFSWHNSLPVYTKTTSGITLTKPAYSNASEQSAIIIKTEANDDEFFVVEYHGKHTSGASRDRDGLLIYRVNMKSYMEGNTMTNAPGGYAKDDFIYIFRDGETGVGNGTGDMDSAIMSTVGASRGKLAGEENTGFDAGTLWYSNGQNSGIVVTINNILPNQISISIQTQVTADEPAIYNGVDYSAVFNATYYANKYADLNRAYGNDKQKLLAHFVNCGMNEGRQAKDSFDVYSYKNRYQDLRKAYRNNLKNYYMHFINNGKREGRNAVNCPNVVNSVTIQNGIDYSAVYDYQYYVDRYSDIKRAYGTDDFAVLEHFVNNGMREGRQAKDSFDVYSYKNRYQDLRKAYRNNLKNYYMHFINNGKREGRNAINCPEVLNPVTIQNGIDYSVVYDYNYYVLYNGDIKKAYGTDDFAVLNHFLNNGMNEGRQAKETFNVNTYRNRYSDLQRAFGNNLKSYYIHYINNGIKEGRSGS